jgi:hypothetical protein
LILNGRLNSDWNDQKWNQSHQDSNLD